MRTIAIDYDGTYTVIPELIDSLIANKRDDVRIILATMRYSDEVEPEFLDLGRRCSQVVFTNRKAKKPFLESLGIKVDVWIDDSPDWILNDAANARSDAK
jgi:hypothetical protein